MAKACNNYYYTSYPDYEGGSKWDKWLTLIHISSNSIDWATREILCIYYNPRFSLALSLSPAL